MKQIYVEVRYDELLWHLLLPIEKTAGGRGFIHFRVEPAAPSTELEAQEFSVRTKSAQLTCSEARQDGFGFLRVIPVGAETHRDDIPAALTIPMGLVAWIAETDAGSPIGFLAP